MPTIFDADRLSVADIAAESRRLAERARTRSLTAAELQDGTFTVSNLGMFGVRRFHAVINLPQVAILAVGEVAPHPVVAEDGRVVAQDDGGGGAVVRPPRRLRRRGRAIPATSP